MAPHSMETILQPPQWPVALSNFVTWCLMWDPKHRPTSAQAMNHEFFVDAVDPLRPKSSTSRLLGKKHSSYDPRHHKDTIESPTLSSKPSWFRKSLIARDSAPAVPQHTSNTHTISPRPSPVHSSTIADPTTTSKTRPHASKRATWTNGTTPVIGAPMPILPSIRPISPLSDAVTAQANSSLIGDISIQPANTTSVQEKATKKIGRQLSVASHGNHYADLHRQEGDRALNRNGELLSPTNGQKESFFSHLRKRARRLSGRHQLPLSPKYDDIEANAGCGPWSSNRSSMALDPNCLMDAALKKTDCTELDKVLQSVRYSLDASSPSPLAQQCQAHKQSPAVTAASPVLTRQHSISSAQVSRSVEGAPVSASIGPISSRTRRALQLSTHPAYRYETPDEEEELLDEALHGAHRAARRMNRSQRTVTDGYRNALAAKDSNRQPLHHSMSTDALPNPYPTPSPSAKRSDLLFSHSLMDEPATPLNISKSRPKEDLGSAWPTPPYEENEWAASAAASIFAVGSIYQ